MQSIFTRGKRYHHSLVYVIVISGAVPVLCLQEPHLLHTSENLSSVCLNMSKQRSNFVAFDNRHASIVIRRWLAQMRNLTLERKNGALQSAAFMHMRICNITSTLFTCSCLSVHVGRQQPTL